jgi:hypothetical protein
MRLAETALSVESLALDGRSRADRQSFIVGHAYAAALDGVSTPYTWKLLIRAVATGEPLSAPMLSRANAGVGVDMVDVEVDPSEYVGAAPDRDQRRALLRWLHKGSVFVAEAQGWDLTPFQSALAAVDEHPEFMIIGPWKGRAGQAKARIVLTETLDGVSAAIETEDGRREQAALPWEAAWMARKSLSDPRWFDGGWVVKDEADRVLLKTLG